MRNNAGAMPMPQITAFTTRLSPAAFFAWLERAEPGQRLAYHRGLLLRDRSPASELTAGDRRAVAEIADAAFRVAEQGRALLVQRRHGPSDFSYLAIKASCGAGAATASARALELPAAA
jgi:hypothetical protein